MDQFTTDNPQSKPKTARMKLSFDNISDEKINEIKEVDDPSKVKAEDEQQDEQSQEVSKKKKKGLIGRFMSWCGKKKEIVRAKTMKYGARLTKNRRRAEPVADKSTLNLASAMAMCKKDEKIEINENI